MRISRVINFSNAMLLAVLAMTEVHAQGQTIEEVARTIASQHNANSLVLKDEMVAASTAKVMGKKIIFENTLRVRQGLSAAKLKQFAEHTQDEVIPKTCAVRGNAIGFDRGMSYQFIYKNLYGDLLADFHVNKAVCERFQ